MSANSRVCSNCGRLVRKDRRKCPHCGVYLGGRFSIMNAVNNLNFLEKEHAFFFFFSTIATFLYLFSLLLSYRYGNIRGLLAPDIEVLYRLGVSGAYPLIKEKRFWSAFSAIWLHGNLLHIIFNILWAKILIKLHSQLFGIGRTVVVFIVSGFLSFYFSALGAFAPLPIKYIMGVGLFSLGASGALLGLMGAIVAASGEISYSLKRSLILNWVLPIAVFGLIVPGIDNWAHLGGFVIGYFFGNLYKSPEKEKDYIIALLLLLASLASVVYNYNLL